MNINSINGDLIEVSLRQLGAASIRINKSNMYFVDFDLGDGVLVSYVFNITSQEKFFLQRMRPYALVQGKFAGDAEIVEFITKDVERFRNAAKSSNFKAFILQAERLNQMVEKMETLFLQHNVDRALLDTLGEHIASVAAEIEEIKSSSSDL